MSASPDDRAGAFALRFGLNAKRTAALYGKAIKLARELPVTAESILDLIESRVAAGVPLADVEALLVNPCRRCFVVPAAVMIPTPLGNATRRVPVCAQCLDALYEEAGGDDFVRREIEKENERKPK